MEIHHQLPLRKCRKFIGDLGERLVHDYFKNFNDLSIEEIFYQQAGYGDFQIMKKAKYKEYKKKLKKIEKEASHINDWNLIKEACPELIEDLLAFENDHICRIDVKTSLGKYPRSTNILTPSQKNRPNYQYILKVKLFDELNDGFTGELNQENLELILSDPKLNNNTDNIDKTVKLEINECSELLQKIGIYLLKDYYTSNHFFVEIMQSEKTRSYLLVYPTKEIQNQIEEMRIGLTYMVSGWVPHAHNIPLEYLVKCKNAEEAEKMTKVESMVNLGSFRLIKNDKNAKNLLELYQGNPFYVWDYKRQSRDYDELLSANADIINIKITFDRQLISDYQNSDFFNKKVHLEFNKRFTKGFQTKIKTEK